MKWLKCDPIKKSLYRKGQFGLREYAKSNDGTNERYVIGNYIVYKNNYWWNYGENNYYNLLSSDNIIPSKGCMHFKSFLPCLLICSSKIEVFHATRFILFLRTFLIIQKVSYKCWQKKSFYAKNLMAKISTNLFIRTTFPIFLLLFINFMKKL